MKTLRITDESADEEERSLRTWLVRIGCAFDPRLGPELYLLDGTERLVLGRVSEQSAKVRGRIEVPDPWMSEAHAELVKTSEGFKVADLASSNGTRVMGEACSSALLADGDVFETGGTFWLFRSMLLRSDPPFFPAEGWLGSLYPPFAALVDRLRKVAPTKLPVMLRGETGTGKEVLARALHQLSGRAGCFVAINTAAVQTTLVASELFGVERGAHSTAERSRRGQIRAAEGGTLLLDEIGDMPHEVQVALLRMIEQSEVLPVGSDVPVPVDVRFVCATHQDLEALVDHGSFRADLYARLKGCVLEIPPLADRREDLGLLIARLLPSYSPDSTIDNSTWSFTPGAYRALLLHHWPLNIRELERALSSAAAVAAQGRIELAHLPEDIRRSGLSAPPGQESDLGERSREIVRLLSLHRGNVSAVARTMGKSRMQVHRWLKQLQIDPSHYRSS